MVESDLASYKRNEMNGNGLASLCSLDLIDWPRDDTKILRSVLSLSIFIKAAAPEDMTAQVE
jgi:hypothetical protein